MSVRRKEFVRILITGLLSASSSAVAGTPWDSVFVSQVGPLQLGAGSDYENATQYLHAPGSDFFVVGANRDRDTVVGRIAGTDGRTVWSSAHSSANSILYIRSVAVTLDGSLYAARDGYLLEAYASDGTLRWVAPYQGVLAANDAGVLALLAPGFASSGQIVFLRTSDGVAQWSTPAGGYSAIASGNFFYVAGCADADHCSLSKVRSGDGSTQWSVQPYPTGAGIASMVVDPGDSAIYVVDASSSPRILKLDPSTGLSTWGEDLTVPADQTASIFIGQSGKPLARIGDGQFGHEEQLVQLSVASTTPSWSHLQSSVSRDIRIDSSGDVYAVTDEQARRLDGSNGTTKWNVALPDGANRIAVHALSLGETSLVVAGDHFENLDSGDFASTPSFVRLANISGALLGQSESFAGLRSVSSKSLATDGDNTVTFAMLDGGPSSVLLVRKNNNADGTVQWEKQVDLGDFGYVMSEPAATTDAVAIAVTQNRIITPDWFSAAGAGKVIKFDLGSGDTLFSSDLRFGGQINIGNAALTVDDAGGVRVSQAGAIPWNGGPSFISQAYLLKFDAAGNVAWHLDFGRGHSDDGVQRNATQYGIGDDLLTLQSPAPSIGGLTRISGADGSIMWSHDIAPASVEGFCRIGATSGVLVGVTAAPALNLLRFSLVDGSVQWNATQAFAGDSWYGLNDVKALGNDLVLAARYGNGESRPAAMLLRVDGTDGQLDWQQHWQAFPLRTSAIPQVVTTQAGDILALETHQFDETGPSHAIFSREYVTRIDAASSARIGSQEIGANTEETMQPEASIDQRIAGLASDGGLMIGGSFRRPGFPRIARVTKLLPPAPVPDGDVSITSAFTPAHAKVGDLVDFDIVVQMTGAHALSGASLGAQLQGSIPALDWTCSAASGAVCGAAAGTGAPDFVVSLQPGSSITLHGHARVLDSSVDGALSMRAYVDPPYAFSQGTLTNDTATSAIGVSLFANGFE